MGSMTLLGAGKPAPAGGGGTDADATLWAAAVYTASGNTFTVSGTQLTRVSNLITAYKAAGVWSLLDREWLYASEDPWTAKVDIKALASHTLVGGTPPNFTTNRGYDSSPSGLAYIDTGYVTGSNFLLNAHSFGSYVYTSRTTGGGGLTVMGSLSTAYTILQPLLGGNTTGQVASSDNSFPTFSNTQANGNYIVTRTSSSNVNLYKNAVAGVSLSATSVALPTLNWFAFAFNSSGSPSQPYPGGDVVASIFMGGVLDATQAAAKNVALNAYMTAVGANVY